MKKQPFSGAGWMVGAAWVGILVLSGGTSRAAGTGPVAGKPGAAKKASASLEAPVEILPGETEKMVDLALPEPIAFVVLGRPGLDIREMDASSLNLAGAAVTKNELGEVAVYRDVNGDGREDLVAQVTSSRMRLGEQTRRVFLSGRMRDGRIVEGSAPLRTVQSVRSEHRRGYRPDPSAEKRAPLPVAIDILPGDPTNQFDLGNRGTIAVAILSGGGVDATTLDPAALTLAGSPATRRKGRGGMASIGDVNGDGLPDLVAEFPKRFLQLRFGDTEAVLRGVGPKGRTFQGSDRVRIGNKSTMTFDSDPVPPLSQPGPEFLQSAGILLNDLAPASPYPSSISVSGVSGVISKVRVTLKNLTHSYPADLDMLLVGPTGQNLLLMSDVGGTSPGVTNISLTFDDDSAATLDPLVNPPTGTYQPANAGAGDTFSAPAPVPSPATSLSIFNGTNPNGVWSLYIVDDLGGDAGIITDGWSIDFIMATEVCNAGAITIFDNSAAAPYPSPINVAGLPSAVSKVTVRLKGLSHTYPDDIDMLLVGPGGQKALVMSDAGGIASGISNQTLVLDDNASLTLDASINPVNGTYRPLDLTPGDVFLGLAPPGPYQSELFQFDGSNPNGFWYLYVLDDAAGDVGSIAGGWCLDITAMTPVQSANTAFNAIPSGQPTVTQGTAFFYPSNIQVSGVHGVISNTTVTLNGLTHTYPQDLDIQLTGPLNGSPTAILMSDVGGGGPGVSGVNLTFDYNAISAIPLAVNPSSGTYRPTNDDSQGPDNFPPPAPSTSSGVLGTFNILDNPNGTWSLYINDDAGGDVGSLSGGWSITLQTFLEPLAMHSPWSYCNNSTITIPSGAPGATQGPSVPYPSGRVVSSFPGLLDHYKVRITLYGLTHSFPSDLDIVLRGGGERTVLLMSDAGGIGPGVSNVDLTFDDDAPAPIPQFANPASGVYRPTDYDDGFADVIPDNCPPSCSATPPTPPFGKSLSVFKGLDPASAFWWLWIYDDTVGDSGSLAGGFCLDFVPSPESGEVANLRWTNNTTLAWDAGANATSYNLYRGDRSQLPSLIDHTADSCARATTLAQEVSGLVETPSLGAFYWYLVRGHNYDGEGPAGFQSNPQDPASPLGPGRIQEASGVCP